MVSILSVEHRRDISHVFYNNFKITVRYILSVSYKYVDMFH
jgi:hypothetical protein